jgi:hypothetical protein
MEPLARALRGKLEQTVEQARDVAEQGADAILKHLGIGAPESPSYLTSEEKVLRRSLRAHGRQLGDTRNEKTKEQETLRLQEEIAYEHWHRMLFARFLAENGLLMYGDVAITLEECEGLASSQGAANGWELAAGLAARMLPQIFRPDSPVFKVALPPEHQQQLERLLADLPRDVFTASDSLGWVYQFWQSKRKDAVNAAEVKIGARELPAVTQLFTEPYMVHFLLDNSLGAWWAGKRLTSTDLSAATNEQELRDKASLPGVPLTYLRFVRGEDGVWTPAAGTFPGWPESLSDFSAMDPCSGSGHFLVSLFEMLVPMRMADEGLSTDEAVDAVLRENIHGLELDRRCVELAAFNVALAAWRYPGATGLRTLPELNLACCGLAIGVSKVEWLALADGDSNLRMVLDEMYNQFADAPTLGSLIDPAANGFEYPMFARKWNDIEPLIARALGSRQDEATQEAAVVAGGLAKTAQLLMRKYTLVTTNPPYLARGKQNDSLKEYCERNFPLSKSDLATVFLERCLALCRKDGAVSMVLPQNWLFLTTYNKLRKYLLATDTWHMVARLGPKGFETPMWDYNVQLITLSRGITMHGSRDDRADQVFGGLMSGMDVTAFPTAAEKAAGLVSANVSQVRQKKQLENPDAVILLEETGSRKRLGDYGKCIQGISPADRGRLVRLFWEVPRLPQGWDFFQGSCDTTKEFNGWSQILALELFKRISAVIGGAYRGDKAIGNAGVSISKMSSLPVSLYSKKPYDGNAHAYIPDDEHHLPALWCYFSSAQFSLDVRKIDQKLDVTNATIDKVPFDLEYWTEVSRNRYSHGLPKPYSDDPTQWVFHGHPCRSVVWSDETKQLKEGPLRVDATVLQVAVARLLGYRWPAELDTSLELSEESRTIVKACDDLLPFADADGIVCIPSVRGEPAAADRLEQLLAAAYGAAWSADTLSQLLAQCGNAGGTLETWLRDKFFVQHCKLFQHRPFVWHIWDGLPDGFAALVDYHRLDRKTMETLIYTYLGSWIARQKQDLASRIDGTSERLEAALQLQERLKLILEGEKPYDIFVRWKPLSQQPIGWDPDLNDGVRMNIRPFVTAHVLRFDKKPQLNISWDKDRGKDVESAPWFKVFWGRRLNDHHTTLDEKRAARKELWCWSSMR